MPRVHVAHIREQGHDMIVVPLADEFEYHTEQRKLGEISELQERANNAGLRGTVVPVWNQHGRMRFIAPRPWHPLFQSLSLPDVQARLNKQLHW